MPTYEYECARCGVFDHYQSIKEDALKRCPRCRGRRIQRLISGGGGVIFKGDGFYETDYRSEDYRKAAKADGDGPSTEAKEGAKEKLEGKQSAPAKPAAKAAKVAEAARADTEGN